MLKRIGFILLLISCGQPKPAEVAYDSLEVIPDSVSQPPDLPEQQAVEIEIDTTFHEFTVENNPATRQLDSTVAYVYKKGGIDIYEVNRDFKIEKVIGHFDYKSKVQLLGPIKNESPLTIDGMKGYYALIQYENKMAYVFTGWLLNLPVPEEPPIFNYLLSTIHVEKASENGKERKYEFEDGISLHYDTIDDNITITIPGLTMQQAFLLANYFIPGMDTFIKQMPVDSALIRVHADVYYKVETKKGKVVRITHEDRSGCYSLMSFSDTGSGVEIKSTIGC